MAKKLTSKQKKEQLNNLFAVYNKRLGRLYSDYIKKLASLGYEEDVLEGDALFNFDNFPELKTRLNKIFNDYYQNSLLCYKNGMTDGVALAFSHDTNVLGAFSVLSDKAIRAVRDNAAATFISSRFKTAKGLSLSMSIWNYCQQTKSEFEMAMSNVIADGIKSGSSAEELGRKIRQYLNDPDMMYRRYHTVKVLKNGQKKDVVTWRRRRVIDGKVRFVEEPLEKVGMGVYRSARKNTFRMARTEINAAYLRGHNERWRNEPFVIGQYIHVSPQHAIDDICNELEGRYPKDFIFASWHPACMCTSDPIMIEGDEKKEFYKRLMAGEDMSNYVSPLAVTDTPEKYRKYIEDNEEAIMKAFRGDKLAWHLADNKKYWQRFMSAENQKEMGYKTISSKGRIMQAAKKRHEQRTQEQIDHIQNRWNKHRRDYYNSLVDGVTGGKPVDSLKSKDLYERYYAIREAVKDKKSADEISKLFERFTHGWQTKLAWTDRKIAMNVMKVAQNYGETDITGIASALKSGNYTLAKQEAKSLAKTIKSIQNDEKALSALIPDVNKWHKQFTSEQLHGVYDAVENKLARWNGLTLEQQAKKLKFESYDFLGGNMHGVQQKYTTWQVSQSAYIKKLNEVTDAIDLANISKAFIADIKSFKTQSKSYHKLVYDLQNALDAKDKTLAQQLYDEAKAKKQDILNNRTKKTVKSNGSIPFDADAYSQARKDAAIWCKSAAESHSLFDADSLDFWNNVMTLDEQIGCRAYTGGSGHMNRPLRGYDGGWGWEYYKGVGKVTLDNENGEKHIKNLYAALEKCKTKKDMWLQRGNEKWSGVEGFFGVQNLAKTDLQKFVGKEFTDWSFTSCGTAKGTGFDGTIFNIYCPKGTKAYYASPHSRFRSENETILQLGTRFRITKVEITSHGQVFVDMEVVGYDQHPLL